MTTQYTTFFNAPIAIGDGENISSQNAGNVVLAQRQFILNPGIGTLWFQLPVRASILNIFIDVPDVTVSAGTYQVFQSTSASGGTAISAANAITTGAGNQRTIVAFNAAGTGRVEDITASNGTYIGVQIAALAPATNINVRVVYFYNT